MLIYLDCCALNRPLDDASQPRIAVEAEAVRQLLRLVATGVTALAASTILRVEIDACCDRERRAKLIGALGLTTIEVPTDKIASTDPGFVWLKQLGMQSADALHVLSALAARADLFITTDNGIIQRSDAIFDRFAIRVLTPPAALAEVVKS